jgi:hypothetical protein
MLVICDGFQLGFFTQPQPTCHQFSNPAIWDKKNPVNMQARMNMDYFKYVIVIETLNSE